MNENINRYIEANKDNMISDLRELVKIPSVAGMPQDGCPFGEKPSEALSKALDICGRAGLFTKNIDGNMGEADFFSDKKLHLGILCHMDVVPAGIGWSVPPFDITECGGKLIGRGAIDDKGPAIAVIYALKAIKELDIPLEKNVRLLFGTNEENGSADLAMYLKRNTLPPLLFTPDGSYPVINIEKGMLRTSLHADDIACKNGAKILSITSGETVNAVPMTAETVLQGVAPESISADFDGIIFEISSDEDKTIIKATGKSAHASTPELGRNALTALLSVLARLTDSPVLKSLCELFPYGETDGLSCGIKCSDDISGETTTVLSVCRSDGKSITCRQDIRFPVCESCDGIISRLQKKCRLFDITADIRSEPHHVPADSEFIKTLLSVYEDVTRNKAYTVAIGGGTYVHDTKNGVAFGAEFPGDENNMHGADEFIKTDSLLLNAKIYAEAIIRLCGKKEE